MIAKIKKHFEKLGYIISLTQHPNYYKNWKHFLTWQKGSAVPRLFALCEYYFGHAEITDSYGKILVKLNDFKKNGYGAKGICKKCGCTQNDACVNEDVTTCHWVEPDLCSSCSQNVRKSSNRKK